MKLRAASQCHHRATRLPAPRAKPRAAEAADRSSNGERRAAMLRCQPSTTAALPRSRCSTARRPLRPSSACARARSAVRCHASANANASSSRGSSSSSSASEEVAAYVEGVTVSPFFRSVPDTSGDGARGRATAHVKVLLLSESNVCRSVLAEAMLLRALASHPVLQGRVQVASKAVKDFCVGEGPDEITLEVAAELGLPLVQGHTARQFEPARDIAENDLVLVMDKFNAADTMKEISVFDTISPDSGFSRRVRLLGSFTRRDAAPTTQPGSSLPDLPGESLGGLHIEDPLYGGWGGEEAKQQVRLAAAQIQAAVNGVVHLLAALHEHSCEQGDAEEASFRGCLRQRLLGMEEMSWLKPPMLSKPRDKQH